MAVFRVWISQRFGIQRAIRLLICYCYKNSYSKEKAEELGLVTDSNVRGGAGGRARVVKGKHRPGRRNDKPTCDDGQERGIKFVSNKTPRKARMCVMGRITRQRSGRAMKQMPFDAMRESSPAQDGEQEARERVRMDMIK